MTTLQGKRPAAHDQEAGQHHEKRSRNDAISFSELLEECGCMVPNGTGEEEYLVEDPRKLRRNLEQRLTLNETLRRSFLDGVREHLEPPEVLHAALKPMTVTGTAAVFTGDSLVRALLNIPTLQRDLSEYLLQRIPEFSSSDDDYTGTRPGGNSTTNNATQAQLILGQFRWLDCLADPHAVTATVLEVLPAMPPEAQRDAISFLPEVAPEDDYPAVLDALESLVADGPEFLIIVLEAASNLALNDAGQARIMEMVASRLQSVDVEDLPAVVRYLLQGAPMSSANTLSTLRSSIHFVTPSDPRLAVPDRKGKWRVPAPGEDPESRVLAAMRQALQFGKGAADAVLKALKAVNTPGQHTTFDFWTLLTLAGLNLDRKRSVHSMMKKKFADEHVDASWLERSVTGHAVALEEQFSSLMALAQHLLSDPTPAVSAAGAALFVTMFIEFSDAYCRQEVLRALHTHLGATATAEATAALRVLQRLAHERTSDLMQYAAFLTTILDYVSGYNPEQLTAAFDVFAELVAGACRTPVNRGGGSGGAGGAGGGGRSLSQTGTGTGGRSRMEDELFIFLRKQLSGAFPAHRRVGSVGVVALVQRLGKEVEEHGDAEGSLLSERYREARALLDSTLTAAASCPDTLAFLCDALAAEAQRGSLPKTLMEYLREVLQERLESQFIKSAAEWTVGSSGAGKEIWWNANGTSTTDEDDVIIALLPPAHTSGAGTGNSTAGSLGLLATLFPTLHAVAALNMAMEGNLASIDALLGCSLGLFTMSNVSPRRYATLDPIAQRQVLHGLFFGLNWCRELVNAFGPVVGAPLVRNSTLRQDQVQRQMQVSLLLRVRAASQLEAALAALLPLAPPMTVLPSLGPAAAAADTNVAAAGLRKPAAGGGKKSSKVKFKDDSKLARNKAGNGVGGGGDSTGTMAPQNSDHQEQTTHSRSTGSHGSSGQGNTGTTGGGHGSTSTAALLAKLTNELALPVAERSKMRVLVPGAITALTALCRVEGNDGMCFSSLPAAAYLLSDLVEKALISLAQPRKAPFLVPFGNKSTTPASPVVSESELLSMLCPAMPALRDHLDNANRITESIMSDKDITTEEESVLKEYFAHSSSSSSLKILEVLPDCPAAKRAASPTASATRVFSGVLECVRLLLSYHEITLENRRSALQAVLSAFSPKTAAAGKDKNLAPANAGASGGTASSDGGSSFTTSQWTSQQFLDASVNTFKYFLQLTPGDAEEGGPTGNEMARWPAVLAVLEALLKVGEKLAADATLTNETKVIASWSKRLNVMRRKLSESASLMLQQRWPSSNEIQISEFGADAHYDAEGNIFDPYNERAAEAPAGGWKGRAAPLTEAIRLSIIYSNEPLKKVEEYVNEGLLAVSGVATGKINSEPLEDLPSLSGVTIGIWYKCLWDVLQNQWKEISAAAKSSSKAAANAAPEASAAIAAGVAACCSAFNSVVTVVKFHERRSTMLNAAAKGGGVFIEGVLRVLPFWQEVFNDQREQVIESIKVIQKATRSLNTLCAEGKVRGDMNVVLRVSRLKKAIESFINESYLLVSGRAPDLTVEFGELKHRDLQGNEQASQMFPHAEEEEEEEEEQIEESEEEQMGDEDEDEEDMEEDG